jgi:hypothetical protein
VLTVATAIPAGHVVSRGDLTTSSVSGVAGAISAVDLDRVVGTSAAVGLVPGQVLTGAMLTRNAMPPTGQRVVGVQVDATRAPAGLGAGDVVTILAVPPAGDASDLRTLESPKILANSASVLAVDGIEGARTRISLVIDEGAANRVATFGAAGRVALVQAPIGSGP